MTDSYYAGAQWRARPESVEECTDRIVAFMPALEMINPMFGTRFDTGRSRKDALRRPIQIERSVLRENLLAGQNRTDVAPRKVIEELGFSFSPWNGQETAVGLRVHCGTYSQWVGNNVVITLPDLDQLEGMLDADFATRLITVMVESWDPDWATVCGQDLANSQGKPIGSVVIGFVAYVKSNRRVGPLFLPKGITRRALHNGELLTIGTDPLNVDRLAAKKLSAHLNRT